MKYLIKVLVVMVLLMQSSFAMDLDAATDEGCECVKLPYEKMEKLGVTVKNAMATGDMSSVMTLQREMMPIMNDTTVCFDKLERKYPEISNDDKLSAQASELMDKKCPRPDMGFPKQQH